MDGIPKSLAALLKAAQWGWRRSAELERSYLPEVDREKAVSEIEKIEANENLLGSLQGLAQVASAVQQPAAWARDLAGRCRESLLEEAAGLDLAHSVSLCSGMAFVAGIIEKLEELDLESLDLPFRAWPRHSRKRCQEQIRLTQDDLEFGKAWDDNDHWLLQIRCRGLPAQLRVIASLLDAAGQGKLSVNSVPWEALEVTEGDAHDWAHAGFENAWVAAEWLGRAIDPNTAMQWSEAGFRGGQADIFLDCGVNDVDEATQLRQLCGGMDSFRRWIRSGFTPEEIDGWIDQGINDPRDAMEKKKSGEVPEKVKRAEERRKKEEADELAEKEAEQELQAQAKAMEAVMTPLTDLDQPSPPVLREDEKPAAEAEPPAVKISRAPAVAFMDQTVTVKTLSSETQPDQPPAEETAQAPEPAQEPADVTEWHKIGISDDAEIRQWINAGMRQPAEAERWRAESLTPEDAGAWNQQHVSTPETAAWLEGKLEQFFTVRRGEHSHQAWVEHCLTPWPQAPRAVLFWGLVMDAQEMLEAGLSAGTPGAWIQKLMSTQRAPEDLDVSLVRKPGVENGDGLLLKTDSLTAVPAGKGLHAYRTEIRDEWIPDMRSAGAAMGLPLGEASWQLGLIEADPDNSEQLAWQASLFYGTAYDGEKPPWSESMDYSPSESWEHRFARRAEEMGDDPNLPPFEFTPSLAGGGWILALKDSTLSSRAVKRVEFPKLNTNLGDRFQDCCRILDIPLRKPVWTIAITSQSPQP